jgi:Sortase domain
VKLPTSRRTWRLAAVAAVAGALAVPVGVRLTPATTATFTTPAAASTTPGASSRPTLGPAPTPFGVTDSPPEPAVVSYTGQPTRLRIPAIRVDTGFELLRLDLTGALETPHDFDKAGWFVDGAAPGDVGPAVVAGHVNSRAGGPAVFARLHELSPGAVVEIDRGGGTVRFRVVATDRYPKNAFPTEKVYGPTPSAELRLITCGGDFNPSRRSYVDNVVVYAVLAD